MSEKIPLLHSFQYSCIFKGLLWSILITIFLGIFLSMLLQYTPLSENLMSAFSTFIFFISIFLGSTIAAHNAGHKGLLYSASVSFSYFFLILFLGLFLNPSLLTFSIIFKKALLTVASSILGGIIGIGLIAH